VFDRNSTGSTGTIDFFLIEIYDDYGSGIPTDTVISADPPVSTINSEEVYAETGPTDSLWIVGGAGSAGDVVTVQIWLKYIGDGWSGDSMSAFDIPLAWDAAVCTVEAVTIGSDFSEWTDMSRIDNQGTEGPPSVSKLVASAFTFGPPVGAAYIPRGTHLAASISFRVLDTVTAPDSTSIDTLVEAFTPPRYLGFLNRTGGFTYTPLSSPGYIRVSQYECGDCNGDTRITFADALYIKNYYFQTPPGSPAPVGAGDANADGRITFADALYIKNYYFQTPPGSPEPCEPFLGLSPPINERHMDVGR
jgi:hypothetical protein